MSKSGIHFTPFKKTTSHDSKKKKPDLKLTRMWNNHGHETNE